MRLQFLLAVAGLTGVACGDPASVTQDTGYRAGVSQEAVVYWWRAVRSPTGPRADSLRSAVTEL